MLPVRLRPLLGGADKKGRGQQPNKRESEHLRIGEQMKRGARRRKDGLRRTHLEPDKMRAFSLRSTIGIDPAWTETTPKGLILHGKALGEESEKLLANS